MSRAAPSLIAALAVASIACALAGASGQSPAPVPRASATQAEAAARLGIRVAGLPGRRVPPPSRSAGTYVARVLIASRVLRAPGGKRAAWFARPETSWSEGPQRLMILRSARAEGRTWLLLRLPVRPNGSRGWIPRDRVFIAHSDWFIRIDRSTTRVDAFRDGRRAASFRSVVGAPATPTPTGLFALRERVPQADPGGFIGPVAVHLTATSEVLRRYAGGPGRIAFHGRGGASLLDPLGSARSHGCVRVANGRARWIARMPMGTAVRIHR